jgi:hypothetical protein
MIDALADVLRDVFGGTLIEVAGIGLGGVEIVLSLLALVGLWLGGRMLLGWLQSLVLRLAMHHLLLGAAGALGLGIETFVDGGIARVLGDLLPLMGAL